MSIESKFSQSFGDCTSTHDADMITKVRFDSSGDYIATGDAGGRIVLFKTDSVHKQQQMKMKHKQKKCVNSNNYDEYDDNDTNPCTPTHDSRQYRSSSYDNSSSSSIDKNNSSYSNSSSSSSSKGNTMTVGNDTYTPYCQFQSHDAEFDYLKSLDIEEKINDIQFKTPSNGNFFLLSTNDKAIKLWKISEQQDHYYECNSASMEAYTSGKGLVLPTRKKSNGMMSPQSSPKAQKCSTISSDIVIATPKRLYQHAHTYHINSLSLNSDGETFLSSDDLTVNIWKYENQEKCFNIIDIKPECMEELSEVITAARFHPKDSNILIYSSSKGSIKVYDTRSNAICDNKCGIVLTDTSSSSQFVKSKSFFNELISSISDINFSHDGRYIVSRDYLSLKIWDINMNRCPVKTIDLYQGTLTPILYDLYEKECLFDKFEAVFSHDNKHVLSGGYSNQFNLCRVNGDSSSVYQSELMRGKTLTYAGVGHDSKGVGKSTDIPISNDRSIRIDKKLLHYDWHPLKNTIALAGQSGLYLYNTISS